ncbi:MAG: restriction endonuclease [Cellulosilyticaceae bacterium]
MNKVLRIVILIIAAALYVQLIRGVGEPDSAIGVIIVVALLLMGMESVKRKKDANFRVQCESFDVNEMDKETFVAYIAELFKKMAYYVEPIKPEKKQGADLLLRKGKQRIAVRCEVGDVETLLPLQELYGGMAYCKSNKALVVCNKYFSDEVMKFAKLNKVQLIDKQQVISMINQVIAHEKKEDALEVQEI